MINKSTSEFDLFDIPNQVAIYDSLIKNQWNLLKIATDVALVYLGSPYYYKRLLEEYPNIKNVHIFVPTELMFICMQFDKNSNYMIQYVKDYKYTFKNCYTKFDCIFINTPVNDIIVAMNILNDSVEYLKDENSKSFLRYNNDLLSLAKKVNNSENSCIL